MAHLVSTKAVCYIWPSAWPPGPSFSVSWRWGLGSLTEPETKKIQGEIQGEDQGKSSEEENYKFRKDFASRRVALVE